MFLCLESIVKTGRNRKDVGAGLKKGFRATKGYRHCGFSATEKNLIVTCSGWHLGYGWWSLFQQCLIHIVSFWDRTVAQKVSASISAATAKEGSGDGLNAREQGSVFFFVWRFAVGLA